MVSIYEGEGDLRKVLRIQLIEKCLGTHRKAFLDSTEVPDYPGSVRAIAQMLKMMEEYDNKTRFPNDDSAYHAQQIVINFETALEKFVLATKELKPNTPAYKAHLTTFNDACAVTMKNHLKGMCNEPSIENFFKNIVNSFFKLINQEPPFKLSGTDISKHHQFKARLNQAKISGIAKDEITEAQNENDDLKGPSM